MITAKEAYNLVNNTDIGKELEKISSNIEYEANQKNTNVRIKLDISYKDLLTINDELIKSGYKVELFGKGVYINLPYHMCTRKLSHNMFTPITGDIEAQYIITSDDARGIIRHIDRDTNRIYVEMFLGSKDFISNTLINTAIGDITLFTIQHDSPYGMNISWSKEDE